jgi:hypothetical protein
VLRPVWRLGNKTKRENLLEVAITKFTLFPTVEKCHQRCDLMYPIECLRRSVWTDAGLDVYLQLEMTIDHNGEKSDDRRAEGFSPSYF